MAFAEVDPSALGRDVERQEMNDTAVGAIHESAPRRCLDCLAVAELEHLFDTSYMHGHDDMQEVVVSHGLDDAGGIGCRRLQRNVGRADHFQGLAQELDIKGNQ